MRFVTDPMQEYDTGTACVATVAERVGNCRRVRAGGMRSATSLSSET